MPPDAWPPRPGRSPCTSPASAAGTWRRWPRRAGADGPSPTRRRERLLLRSDGLPFAVEELLAAPDSAVPPTLAALVAGRLAALPEPARAILHTAAVLGPELDWRLLAPATPAAEPDGVAGAARRRRAGAAGGRRAGSALAARPHPGRRAGDPAAAGARGAGRAGGAGARRACGPGRRAARRRTVRRGRRDGRRGDAPAARWPVATPPAARCAAPSTCWRPRRRPVPGPGSPLRSPPSG